jgi:hypothetical protein
VFREACRSGGGLIMYEITLELNKEITKEQAEKFLNECNSNESIVRIGYMKEYVDWED